MNVVDTSGWLEYFANSPLARHFAPAIEDTENLLVPGVVIYEIFKKICLTFDEGRAFQAIAQIKLGRVTDIDESVALYAAKASIEKKLPMADALIYATAVLHSQAVGALAPYGLGVPLAGTTRRCIPWTRISRVCRTCGASRKTDRARASALPVAITDELPGACASGGISLVELPEHVQEEPDVLLKPHSLCRALDKGAGSCVAAYRELFRYELEPGLVDEIRRATNGNHALGNAAFAVQVSTALGWRAVPGKSGRHVERWSQKRGIVW